MTTATTTRAVTNRKLSLLGACGLLVFTVIQVPHLVVLWKQLDSHYAHREQMLAGFSQPGSGSSLSEQLQAVRDEVQELDKAMVDAKQMPTIQSELMELARASGCQLRKAVVQTGSSATWELEKSDEEFEEAENGAIPQENPYKLNTEQISLSLTGTRAQTFDFLGRVRQREWLMRVAQISFARDPEAKQQLIVEANLAFYQLSEEAQANDETLQWREGSRATATR